MKNLIYVLIIAFTISSCKKENIEKIESLKGSYIYNYSFTKVSSEYDMNSNTYSTKTETGQNSRQIEIINSPNSDKELIIVNLLDQDETTIYFPDGINTFKMISNNNDNLEVTGYGSKKGDELHFNIELISSFDSNKFDGVAIRK